jgi:1,4-alpha-glucan branching enzyme
MNRNAIGQFSFVLHAHLPYVVSHGTWPHGSDMIFECAAESYLPLLEVLDRLAEEGSPPKVTLGLTPVLVEQLAQPAFKAGLLEHLEMRIRSAAENAEEFSRRNEPHLAYLAERWRQHFADLVIRFRERYQQDLVGAFRRLQDQGQLEILTSAATHGYLPLLGRDASLQAQVRQGVVAYRRHFGRLPQGFWLPECAYRPRYEWASPLPDAGPRQPHLRKGVEEFLAEEGIAYFIIDTPTLIGGETIGAYLERFPALRALWERFSASYRPAPLKTDKSPYRSYLLASAADTENPIAVFTRDEKTGIQVWSGEWGYPGDGWYLDFHKKHFPGGLRYWRVTDAKADLADKWQYEPDRAAGRVLENAGHFKQLVKDVLAEHRANTGEQGFLCAAYDAELLGHWWFEGPDWLYQVLKWMSQDPELEVVTCSERLAQEKPTTAITLPEGSWGKGGFHWIWLNEWTTWIWRRIYEAEEEMQKLARLYETNKHDSLRAIITQAGRELLLLQSSDWPFLISTWSARDYAEGRAAHHFEVFRRLAEMAHRFARGDNLEDSDWAFLGDRQREDSLFPDHDPTWFGRLDHPPKQS